MWFNQQEHSNPTQPVWMLHSDLAMYFLAKASQEMPHRLFLPMLRMFGDEGLKKEVTSHICIFQRLIKSTPTPPLSLIFLLKGFSFKSYQVLTSFNISQCLLPLSQLIIQVGELCNIVIVAYQAQWVDTPGVTLQCVIHHEALTHLRDTCQLEQHTPTTKALLYTV